MSKRKKSPSSRKYDPEIFNIYTGRVNLKLFLICFLIQLSLFIIPVAPLINKIPLVPYLVLLAFLYLVVLNFIILKIYTRREPRRQWVQHLAAGATVASAYGLYLVIFINFALSKSPVYDSEEITHFLSTWVIGMLIGYTSVHASKRYEKEREVEQLKMETLQSRCEALANQMNPHFFFNSMNGIAALVREDNKEQNLEYLGQMAKVFRYILQINKESMVPLEEELGFVNSYMYMLQIRYGDSIQPDIGVEVRCDEKILPLTLLPLLENVVKHNTIDSRHPMKISITRNAGHLEISNPVCEKLEPVLSDKVGLANLSHRYRIVTGKDIQVSEQNGIFSVRIPIITSSL